MPGELFFQYLSRSLLKGATGVHHLSNVYSFPPTGFRLGSLKKRALPTFCANIFPLLGGHSNIFSLFW